MSQVQHYDMIIIGTGAGGTLAYALAPVSTVGSAEAT
jgi:choline dehydrogenase-like flavoprotein